MNEQISRRKFLHQSSVGVAAVSALGFANSCEKKTETKTNAPMPMRGLGKTGLQVSQLAFGGGSQFLKNKDGAWEPLLERAIKLGINYFDDSAKISRSSDHCDKILQKGCERGNAANRNKLEENEN